MGIIEQAKQMDRTIRSARELLEKEMETVRIVYEHNAISEAEFIRSMTVLENRLSLIS